MNKLILVVIFLWTLFLGFLTPHGYCSDSKKWGKPEKKYLGDYVYAEDTSAVAVKIFDVSDMQLTLRQGVELNITRHYQIKILKDAGKDYADVAISYWHEDKFSKVKAHTILPNGKKVKLKKKQIFNEERKSNYKVKKFILPSVEVGSIIEVEYEYYTKYFTTLEPWTFQSEIPTIESLVSLKLSPGFKFKANIANDPHRRVTGFVDSYLDVDQRRQMKKFIWTGKNLPAVKNEPYISSLENYKTRLEFQFTSYTDKYTRVDFIKDLPTLCNELLDGKYGSFLKPSGESKKIVKTLLPTEISDKDKAKALYNFVRDEIGHDVSTRYFVRRNQKEIIKKKAASNSEKNMLLISLLRAAGIDAKPTLISTRDNGRINSALPFLDQYNRTCVYAFIDSRHYLMDTSDRYVPFGFMPPNALVDIGLIIEKDNPNFVRNSNKGIKSKEKFLTESKLSYTGSLSGYTTVQSKDYASRRRNWQLEGKNDVKAFFTESIGSNLDGFEITQYDSSLTAVALADFETQFEFTLEEHAETIDDEIYFTPFLYKATEKNIFVSEKREFPVEYGYCWQSIELHSIILPDGAKVVEIPEDKAVDNKYFSYNKTITSIPGRLICSRTFEIKKPEVPPADYQLLKRDYARIVDSDQAQVILNVVNAKGSN